MKEILQGLVDRGLSTRQIGKEIGKSQGSVKHQLRKYELQTKRSYIAEVANGKKVCSKCKEELEIAEFYNKAKGSERKSNICKKCSNTLTIDKMIETKIKMILYKGGGCIDCGLKLENSHYAVYDFHHRDREKKEVNPGKMRAYKWERIVTEIDKCDLLCANCHRMRHVTDRVIPVN